MSPVVPLGDRTFDVTKKYPRGRENAGQIAIEMQRFRSLWRYRVIVYNKVSIIA